MGRQWPASGSGTLTATVLGCTDDGISPLGGGCITPTIVWSQAKLQGGNTVPSISIKLG